MQKTLSFVNRKAVYLLVGLAELLSCAGYLPEASNALHFQGGHGKEKALSISVGDLVDWTTPIVPQLTKINRIVETLKTEFGRNGGKTLGFLEEDIYTGEAHVLCSPLHLPPLFPLVILWLIWSHTATAITCLTIQKSLLGLPVHCNNFKYTTKQKSLMIIIYHCWETQQCPLFSGKLPLCPIRHMSLYTLESFSVLTLWSNWSKLLALIFLLLELPRPLTFVNKET